MAAFARESGPWLEQLSRTAAVICQVAGHSVDEFVRALEMYVELCPRLPAEINVSCPNRRRRCPWAPRPRAPLPLWLPAAR